MPDDARQIVADYIKLSGSTGSHAITRREQVRVRTAIFEVTLDSDSATTIDLNSVGLKDPVVLNVRMMAIDSSATGNWEAQENKAANTASRSFQLDFNDGTHASPYTLDINTVGANMQGELARFYVEYIEREP